VEARVDDLEPGVTEGPRDDVCAPVVAVQSDFGDETANRLLFLVCAHIPQFFAFDFDTYGKPAESSV
jgi:hypothetical protein